MALVKGTNSYVTVAEADTYFAELSEMTAWTSADEVQKAQALVSATAMLDDMSWTGTAISESQPLAFPRAGYYFDPKVGSNVTMSSSVPSRITTATMLQAYHVLNNEGITNDTGLVKSLTVGSIKLETILPPSKIPNNVLRMVKPLLKNAGSNSWWRAN